MDVPDPQQGVKWWHGVSLVLTGLLEAAGAERRLMGTQITASMLGQHAVQLLVVNRMVLCGSVRSVVCMDRVTESASKRASATLQLSHSRLHQPV